jgi:hypothetical protein
LAPFFDELSPDKTSGHLKKRRQDAGATEIQFTTGLFGAYGFLTLGLVFPYGGLPNV